MKTPKVAFVRQRYAQDGGAERFVSRALDALRPRNVSLTLVTREWCGGEGFEVLTCNPFYRGRLWRDWSFARAVCRELGKRSFDLVQSHERLSCCDIYRAGDGVHREWLKQRAHTQGLFSRLATALIPYHYYVKAAEKKLFKSPRLKAVICNSRMVRDEIRHYFGVPGDRLHVIYSGVDTTAYHPDLKRHRAEIRRRHGIPDNAALFLFVGSGFERKGVAALLRALAALPEQACLLVVGRDKRLAKYQKLAAALDFGQRVVFAGSQTDVRPYYGAADALVLPTLYDPFPNVALEAMASGLAVVTSTKCGVAELIRPGENGFVVDSQDVDGLTQSLSAFLDSERAMAMGRAARATVESMRLDKMSEELVDLYQGLL